MKSTVGWQFSSSRGPLYESDTWSLCWFWDHRFMSFYRNILIIRKWCFFFLLWCDRSFECSLFYNLKRQMTFQLGWKNKYSVTIFESADFFVIKENLSTFLDFLAHIRILRFDFEHALVVLERLRELSHRHICWGSSVVSLRVLWVEFDSWRGEIWRSRRAEFTFSGIFEGSTEWFCF